jgi:hypothetical protein
MEGGRQVVMGVRMKSPNETPLVAMPMHTAE